MELRLKMYEIMKKQGHEEETGKTKITSGYNLPAIHKYSLQPVPPIIQWEVYRKRGRIAWQMLGQRMSQVAADTEQRKVGNRKGDFLKREIWLTEMW